MSADDRAADDRADDDRAAVVAGGELRIEPWGSGAAGVTGSWSVEEAAGSAAALHGAPLGLDRRTVRVHRVPRPAVVLGSTQSEDLVDLEAARLAGVEVARRRSGGGVVYLAPEDQAWIDVGLPAGDPLWHDDIGRSSWWLGEVWAAVVAGSVTGGAAASTPHVHHGGVSDRALGRLVCFAAVGPGEVDLDGRKVVGISQRRSREGARFQCVAYRRWDPEPMLSLLRLGDAADEVAGVLRRRAGGLEPADTLGSAADGAAGEWSVVEDLLHRLP